MAAIARIELPHAGASGVPFMKSNTGFSAISCSTLSLRVGSVIGTHASEALLRHRGLDRERVQLARVGAPAERVLDQPVLFEAAHALELRGGDVDPQVVAAALVDHLGSRPGQCPLDQRLDVVDESHGQAAVFALFEASTISSVRQNLTRGRPCGLPASTSAASIACQPSKVT